MPIRPSGAQSTRETSTPCARNSLTIRRPNGVSTSREIQPAVVPNRHNAIATLDSAPATCTSSCGACSSGTPGGADSRSIVSPMVTTSGMPAPSFLHRLDQGFRLCLQPYPVLNARAEQTAPDTHGGRPGRDERARIRSGDPAGGDEWDILQWAEEKADVIWSKRPGWEDLHHHRSMRVSLDNLGGRHRSGEQREPEQLAAVGVLNFLTVTDEQPLPRVVRSHG